MTEPTSYFADVNGLRLHYLSWQGGGERGPIVLSHATGFLARLWEPIAVRLADAGYVVHAADARGHGDSEVPEVTWEHYDWHRFADDLRGFLDHLRLRDVPFVGHSMGAGVALFVAGHHPEYFSRIAAIEPILMPGGFVPDEDRRDQMAESARRRRAVFGSREEAFQQYRNRPTFERWPDDTLWLYVNEGTVVREDGQVELKCLGAVEGEVFASSGTLETWDVLPDISVPVLIMRGEQTEPFVGMIAEQAAGRIPGARLLTVPELGHLLPMEHPELAADEVLTFLDEP
jgi:pimeloyl-ACP methyl ester carboxylesterase